MGALKVLVISLREQSDRRSILMNKLFPVIEFEFVDALRGSEVLADESALGLKRQLYSGRIGRKLTASEIGCSLSHRKALDTFLKTNTQWGLILEDDAEISLTQRAHIFQLIDVLADHPNCDLVKLGGFGDRTSHGEVIAKTSSFSVLNVVTFGVCSHGYIVSKRGAEKISRAIEPVTEPYDTFLRSVYRHKCKMFETAPWLVSLQENHLVSSTITAKIGLAREEKVDFFLKLKGRFEKRFYNLQRWRHGLLHFGLKFIFKKRMLTQLSTTEHR
jgi:glycosyl transferase family 25